MRVVNRAGLRAKSSCLNGNAGLIHKPILRTVGRWALNLFNPTPSQGARPWLMESVAGAAVLVSTGFAGVGVAQYWGWACPWTAAGTAGLVAVTLLTEIAASRMLLHAEKHFAGKNWVGSIKGVLALIVGFGGLTIWNVIGTHAGLSEIDHQAVAERRAPLERTLAGAEARLTAATSTLEAFDTGARAQQSLWQDALRGVNPSYVTAGTRRLEAADAATQRRIEARQQLANEQAAAIAARDNARTALTNGPRNRDDRDLWIATIVLELLKGALVWLATAGERRKLAQGLTGSNDRPAHLLSERELEDMMARGGSMISTARWELKRRLRAI